MNNENALPEAIERALEGLEKLLSARVENDDAELTALCERAVEKYGYTHQICKAIEELGELSRALSRYIGLNTSQAQKALYGGDTPKLRYELDSVIENIREEMADVCIVCNQLEIMFGHDARIAKRKLEKLRGLIT